MAAPESRVEGQAERSGPSSPERPLALAAWGLFLIWVAVVRLGAYGPGTVLLGGGAILLLHQGARKAARLRPRGAALLAGVLLLCGGLWQSTGADLQVLPLLIFAAGVALLVIAWKDFTGGR